jgi:hypothetical protein
MTILLFRPISPVTISMSQSFLNHSGSASCRADHRPFHRSGLLALLLLLMPAASCSGPAKRFYLLTAEAPLSASSSALRERGAGIGLGPVAVAGYLDRPNMVFQQSPNQLAVSESNRWAGDLAENITCVMAVNLGRLLGTTNVRAYPWDNDSGLAYQVAIDIRHLKGDAEGNAQLEAAWRVYALPARTIAVSRSWSGTEPLSGDGYDALAAAESRLLARLADEIAAGMR